MGVEIITNSDHGGDWWRVIVMGRALPEEGAERRGKVISVAGRVVDRWDGRYSAFFTLPKHGDYWLVLALEWTAW